MNSLHYTHCRSHVLERDESELKCLSVEARTTLNRSGSVEICTRIYAKATPELIALRMTLFRTVIECFQI